MWVLKKLNQEQELASGKFSSQSKLAEFMGIHPRTLNKALKEGRNSFQFRGEIVSVHQLPEFSAHDSSGNQKFFEKEVQIVEFFGVSRQTVYLAFRLNQSEKKFKKDGKVWIVKRNFSPEDEVPICKDQRSQSLKIPTSTSTSTSTKKKSVPDQRSHTMKPSYTKQIRLPRKPPPPAEDLREEWEKFLDEANREAEMEEKMRNENIRNFLRSQRPWFIVPPTFPAFAPRYALFHPDTNTSKIVWCYTDAEYYFQDQGLNFYLTKDEFENEKRPVLDFFVDSPEDLNAQYWKRYIFIWPIGVTHYNIDAKPPRQPLSKPPSEAVSEVISESPEN